MRSTVEDYNGSTLGAHQEEDIMSTNYIQDPAHQIDTDIIEVLERMEGCTIGLLCGFLPQYTWNQVFAVVDRLSRDGSLIITRQGRFDYLISPVPSRSASQQSGRVVMETSRACAD
jgi:hypothetical protein